MHVISNLLPTHTQHSTQHTKHKTAQNSQLTKHKLKTLVIKGLFVNLQINKI